MNSTPLLGSFLELLGVCNTHSVYFCLSVVPTRFCVFGSQFNPVVAEVANNDLLERI